MSDRVLPEIGALHPPADWDRLLFDAYRIRHVLDIGANIGGFVHTWLARGATRVHAIEPVPECFETLERTFGADPRVTCHRLGVSDVPSQLVGANVFNCWTLLPDGKQRLDPALEFKGKPPFDVELCTIDELLVEWGFEPDFVKIDVDGYDAKALRGAEVYLARQRPVLMLEVSYLPDVLGDCCECMIRDLFDFGYVVTRLDGGKRYETARDFMRTYPWDTSFDVIAEPRS